MSDLSNKESFRLLHLPFDLETAAWVGSLQSAVAQSADPRIKGRYEKEWKRNLAEPGLAVTTRLAMLEVVKRRLTEHRTWLGNEISCNPDAYQRNLASGAVFPLSGKKRVWELLVDLDSFLFESSAAYEIVGKFVLRYSRKMLCQRTDGDEILEVLRSRGVETGWIDKLRGHRNFFIHQTAPWLAVSVGPDSSLDLVILSENLLTYDEEKCIRFQVFREISAGFYRALSELGAWLKERVSEFERSE